MRNRLIIGALLATTVLAFARPLLAAPEEGAVVAHGRCSGASIWEMTMKPDIGLEMEAHLETGVPDQVWHLRMSYHGDVFFETTEVTEEDGGFEVANGQRNEVGWDRFELSAINVQTGERCVGGVEAEL